MAGRAGWPGYTRARRRRSHLLGLDLDVLLLVGAQGQHVRHEGHQVRLRPEDAGLLSPGGQVDDRSHRRHLLLLLSAGLVNGGADRLDGLLLRLGEQSSSGLRPLQILGKLGAHGGWSVVRSDGEVGLVRCDATRIPKQRENPRSRVVAFVAFAGRGVMNHLSSQNVLLALVFMFATLLVRWVGRMR